MNIKKTANEILKEKTVNFLEENRQKIIIIKSINDPDLHIIFKSMIEEIIKNCERDKVFDKVYDKYYNILKEINESSDPIKFVIDLLIKYDQFEFKPHLYYEKPYLLISITRLELFFNYIADQNRHKDDPKKLEEIR
ncbi:hypothetical protein F8M41_026153 [Gigaspora margarita]|uniref:Uncharacterized protein n=1 Tax=Gigaspora margarita TaxID=4874 RepID=A0A8H4A9L6_GIGMA|nr:hypothetical protein F8M41_026153 [Gigaspora margarita]